MNTLPLAILGKRLLSPFYRHSPGDRPDIFIFSTQRSGSTLLFDMTASQSGMKAVGEPLQERKQPITRRYLPNLYSRYVQMDTAMEAGMARYFDDLLAGRFVGGFERSYDRRNPRHHYITDRNVVKILRANHLLPWFIERFPGRYVFLVRHPIPVALSRARNGWIAPLKAFSEQRNWYSRLTAEQRDFVATCRDAGTVVQHLAVWFLEHVGMPEVIESIVSSAPVVPPLTILFYEEMLLQPEATLNTLVDTLAIDDVDAFRRSLHRPSRSSRYSESATHTAIHDGDTRKLIERWQSTVDTQIIRLTGEALRVFGIPWYEPESPYPITR